MRIEHDVKLDFNDVLIRPKRSTLASRKEVDLCRSYTFKHSGKEYYGIPIMASNMDGVGTFEMAQALQEHLLFTCLVKSYTLKDWLTHIDNLNTNHCAISIGTGPRSLEILNTYLSALPSIDTICIDVANGYSEHFGVFVEKVREKWPEHIIIAGNVVTGDMTQELILRGADIVKVGIGPGSVCTTRLQTGVGYPQFSAIMDCGDAAHGLGGHIISDGGCSSPGDVAKAFGAGADFVMLGGMFAGHDQGNGQIIERRFQTGEFVKVESSEDIWVPKYETKKFVEFYGMSSSTAMEKHSGGVADYRSSEGRTVQVPYRGNVQSTVLDLLGGLRSTCTYVGAASLKHLSKCTTFVRCTQTHNRVYENSTIKK